MADFGGRPATRGGLAAVRLGSDGDSGPLSGTPGRCAAPREREIRRRVRPSAMGRRRPESRGDPSASAIGVLGPLRRVPRWRRRGTSDRRAQRSETGWPRWTFAAASRRRGAITRSDRSMRRVPAPALRRRYHPPVFTDGAGTHPPQERSETMAGVTVQEGLAGELATKICKQCSVSLPIAIFPYYEHGTAARVSVTRITGPAEQSRSRGRRRGIAAAETPPRSGIRLRRRSRRSTGRRRSR